MRGTNATPGKANNSVCRPQNEAEQGNFHLPDEMKMAIKKRGYNSS